jgi:hypothetical protein
MPTKLPPNVGAAPPDEDDAPAAARPPVLPDTPPLEVPPVAASPAAPSFESLDVVPPQAIGTANTPAPANNHRVTTRQPARRIPQVYLLATQRPSENSFAIVGPRPRRPPAA